MSTAIDKIKTDGPNAVALDEAKFFVGEGHLRLKPLTSREAFELGVALGTSPAHQEYIKTGRKADILDRERTAKGTAYALPPKGRRGKDAPPDPVKEITDEVMNPARIRAWAIEQGMPVNHRGRLSQSVQDAYLAHLQMQSQKKRATAKAPATAGGSRTRRINAKVSSTKPKPSTPAKSGAAARRAKLKTKPATNAPDPGFSSPEQLPGEKPF